MEMLSVALKAEGDKAWARNGLLSFAPAAEEITFMCLWNSSSPAILLNQSSQNAIKRELEHRAKAIYPGKCEEEI